MISNKKIYIIIQISFVEKTLYHENKLLTLCLYFLAWSFNNSIRVHRVIGWIDENKICITYIKLHGFGNLLTEIEIESKFDCNEETKLMIPVFRSVSFKIKVVVFLWVFKRHDILLVSIK